jgi:alpha-N-arabinofuranosidase
VPDLARPLPPPADVGELFGYRRDDLGPVRLTLDATRRGRPLPAELLGNFFEHMAGAAEQLGADLLRNPGFAQRHHLTDAQRADLLANGRLLERHAAQGVDPGELAESWRPVRAGGFGVAVHDDEAARGIPLPWAAMGPPGAVRDAAGRVGGAVRLLGGRSDPEGRGPAGVRQAVFPTPERCAELRAEIWLRAAGTASDGRVELGVRRRQSAGAAEETLAQVRLEVAREWTHLTATLRVDPAAVAAGEPVDAFARWTGPPGTSLLIDRFTLQPADATHGLDPAVVGLLARSTVPQLRWPGGNYVSYYRWRDGVGPVDRRPTDENRAWGGIEPHAIGTDEFLALCAAIGARPHITVNAGTSTAEEAAAWVEYCNGSADTPMGGLRARNGHAEPYGVTVWEVGNEAWGTWQGGFHGSTEHAERFLEFARAMRAASPVPLTLLACGNWYDFVDPDNEHSHVTADGRWHAELLRLGAEHVDQISLHNLPLNDLLLADHGDREAHEAIHATVVSGERAFLPGLLRACDEVRGPARPPVELAITEWGPLGDHPARINLVNGGSVAFAGAVLNSAGRMARVAMTSPNGLLHGGSVNKVGGTVYTDPQFDVIQLYADLIGAVPIRCDLTGPGYDVARPCDLGRVEPDVPYLDVLAVRLPDERLAVTLASRHLTDGITLRIDLGAAVGGAAEVVTLAPGAVTDVASPARTEPVPSVVRTVQVRDGVLDVQVPPLGLVRVVS